MVSGEADSLADFLDHWQRSSRRLCLLPELEIRCRLECVRGTGICCYREDADR